MHTILTACSNPEGRYLTGVDLSVFWPLALVWQRSEA